MAAKKTRRSASGRQSEGPGTRAEFGSDTRMFDLRFERSRLDLFEPLERLYGHLPEYAAFTENLVALLRRRWEERSEELKDLDLRRDLQPEWFLSEKMVAYVFYVDRFSGRMAAVLDHLPYLKSLGVTYVHFMPCLKPRPGDSDGGYSVMDYREIDPALGSMADFEAVAAGLRAEGISVCVDLVLNHTAKEHEWARKALGGSAQHQAYYLMFDSDEMPNRYEETLLDVFPAHAPGNFTRYPELGKWVWTTFNEHQWDLNWANPAVFLEIVDVMLHLANRGVEVLRLDAVAFMWKRLGTVCQNLPEVHDILQALRAATRISAAAVIHKAEAIVAPRDLVPYLGAGAHVGREANLAYHNNLMVQYWASLATGDTALMSHTLSAHFPPGFKNASWATYIRCHDDIGWAITEEDAGAFPHMTGAGHRRFLADFYSGTFPGSFARGAIFQENPETGDRRNSGSFASLAGLEAALETGEPVAIDLAIKRILLGHSLIASFGGLPLLYMGDEVALLNDASYATYPDKVHDNRWMHRPAMDWNRVEEAERGESPPGWVLRSVRHIMARRASMPELAATVPTRVFRLNTPSIFAFARPAATRTVACLFNFTRHWQSLTIDTLTREGVAGMHDFLADEPANIDGGFLHLGPYQSVWIG